MRERPFLPALHRFLVFLLVASAVATWTQTVPGAPSPGKTPIGRPHRTLKSPSADHAAPKVCVPCIHAHMNFLASDALRGRGSGTSDELVAAAYVGSQLQQYGVEPAGDDGSYIQRAVVEQQTITAPPQLHFMTPGDGIPAQSIRWTHGKEMLILSLVTVNFKGPLKRVDTDRSGLSFNQTAFARDSAQDAPKPPRTPPGAVVLILGKDRKKVQATALAAVKSGAIAVLAPASPATLSDWDERAKELPTLPKKLENSTAGPALGARNLNWFALNDEAMQNLNGLPDGTMIYFEATATPPEKSFTWNAVGRITGADPVLRKSAILLSAHLDHLGIGPAVNGETTYHGADDDASGTTAVLELARALASGPKPKRTVVFALFGSEEVGGLGSSWFEQNPPVPLADIAANLEFEMIGRPDPKYPGDSLWLSGWERSNLGPTLAAHGGKLVADARPLEHFFQRSDNYVLARKGVVAQTASSFGLHPDYHQPTDDVAHIDFPHMARVIGSLIPAIEWLVNSSFKPEWKPGGRP